jgi:hypothetical protein
MGFSEERWRFRQWFLPVTAVGVAGLLAGAPAYAQESDAETKALDSTATQWSFQLAYQTMPDYHDDIVSGGSPRPAGATDYLQFRVVMPLPYDNFTILPRVTLRHYENAQGQSGLGNTEVFGLIVPKSWDWGTGRMGIGPLVTLPGDKEVATDEWGYGVAAAWVNGTGNWFYGVLLTLSWQSIDPAAQPAGTSDTNPLGIAPFLNYRLGNGWYVSNGDQVIQYDWDSKEFKIPIGVRLGKVLVKEKGTWNYYFEYQTSAVYENWPGSAVKNSFRFNVTYTIPAF